MSLKQFFRRIKYGEPIVVVSGLPRSGTSMAMKMLAAGGMGRVIDDKRIADEDNPKGYFEDERVLGLGENEDRRWLKEARGKAIKIIAFLLGYLPETNNYKVIFMDRDYEEVLASQKKMLDRRGEKSESEDDRMIELYDENLSKIRFQLRYRECYDVIHLKYHEAIADPRATARKICEFVGQDMDQEAMAAVVDKSLYRNRKAEPSQAS